MKNQIRYYVRREMLSNYVNYLSYQVDYEYDNNDLRNKLELYNDKYTEFRKSKPKLNQ